MMARSWKLEEWISPNNGAFSSFMRCSAAMLATNPMPGKPSIRMGSFNVGFSVRWTVQTMVFSLSAEAIFAVMFLSAS